MIVYSTRFIHVIIQKISLLTLVMLLTITVGHAQLVPNTYTPITSGNNLDPVLEANSQICIPLTPNCVINLNNIIGPLGSPATIRSTASTNWLQVTFNEKAPAGSYAGFVIQSGINLLSNIEVTVFDSEDPNISQSINGTNLLSLGLGGNTKVGFYPSIAFDRLRISYTAVSGSLDVYYAEVMVFETADELTCNVPTVMNRPEFPLTVSITENGGTVANPENAVDALSTNYASLSVPIGGSASLAVRDEISTYPANTYVGFDVENTSILSLTLLDDITIRTYLGGEEADEFSGAGSLASLQLLNSNVTRIGFLTTQEFEEVEIEISSTGINLGETRVYNAVIQCFNEGPGLMTCNEPITLTAPNFPVYISERTGITGTLDNSEIVNAGNVIDNDLNNYAELGASVVVNSEISLGVKDAISDYPAGTYVGFDIEKTGSLLNLELLNAITISSYLNGNHQESRSGSNLLLGVDILKGSNRNTVGFVTTTAVDEVVITLDTDLVGVIVGTTYIYGAIFQCFTEGPGLEECNTYTRPTAPEYPLTISRSEITGAACAACDILNTDNIIDSDLNNSAQLNFTGAVAATISVGVKDQVSSYPAGTFAGFDIEKTASLLDLELLNSITITTYEEGTLKESTSSQNLALSAGLISGEDRFTVGFVTEESFDEVVLSIDGGLVNVDLGAINVYSLVLKCFAEGPALACNTNTMMDESVYPWYLNMEVTGVDGTIGVNNQISDLPNLLDGDPDSYASITQTVSGAATSTIAINKALSEIDGGTFVGFDIGYATALGVDLISGMTLSTYSGGVLSETFSSDNLILVPADILSGDTRQIVGFVPEEPFDEVRIEFAKPVGVSLGEVRVYGLVLKRFCASTVSIPCNIPYAVTNPDFPVYINGERTGVEGLACVDCGIDNPEYVIDDNLDNFATLSFVASALSPIHFSVAHEIDEYPANTFVGFEIGTSALLNVDVAGSSTIRLYNNGDLVQTSDGNTLLAGANTSILDSDNFSRQPVGIIAQQPYDEVQISFEGVGGAALGEIRIYNALFSNSCSPSIACNQSSYLVQNTFPAYINSERTGLSGAVGALGGIEDVWNIVDNDINNYALLTLDASVLETASIAVVEAVNTFPAGVVAGFTIEINSVNIVELDLFNSIQISTYNNGVFQESGTGATDLINLELLGLNIIGSGGGIFNVGFVTTLPFDEIVISFPNVVSANLFEETRIYGAYIDTRFVSSGQLDCIAGSYNPDFNVTYIDIPVEGNVSTNDQPNGTAIYGPFSAELNNPSGGALTLNNDGSYEFTSSSTGVFHFDVQACEDSYCTTRTLQITVVDDNIDENPPIVNPDYGSGVPGSPITLFSLSNDKPGNVNVPLDISTVSIISNPANGTAVIDESTGNITYTPDPGFIGRDSLEYQVCDEENNCGSAWQYFTIIPLGLENTTDATDDFIYIPYGETGTGNVSENDIDPEGDGQSVNPQNTTISGAGTFVLSMGGDYTFTPDAGFSGPVDIVYTTSDNGNPSASASATLHILVGNAPDGPHFNPDFNVTYINVSVDGDVSTNDQPDGDASYGTPQPMSENPGGATITMMPSGAYTFTSSNTGVFNYQVPIVINGTSTSRSLQITVLDGSVMTNPPVVNPDYGRGPLGEGITLVSLANDGPGNDGVPLDTSSITITAGPFNGSASVNPSNGNITYTPDPGFIGRDSLEYVVCDQNDNCASAYQYFTITPADVANSTDATDDYIFVPYGESISGNVSTNDVDPEGDGQTVSGGTTTEAGVGTLDLASDGSFTFTPEPGFSGSYAFTYETCDDGSPQACAMATLHVLGEQPVPDLTPTIDIDALNFTASSSARDFIVNIFEIQNVQTSAPIVIRITKLPAFTISYNINSGTSDVFGGIMNENGNWNISENSGFITFTSKSGINISALGSAKIGLTISPNTGTAPNTSQNITATIVGGSGGEINVENNRSIVTITQN